MHACEYKTFVIYKIVIVPIQVKIDKFCNLGIDNFWFKKILRINTASKMIVCYSFILSISKLCVVFI
jgi:hypothetical protein